MEKSEKKETQISLHNSDWLSESREQAYLEMPSLYALVLFSCFYSDSRWYKQSHYT